MSRQLEVAVRPPAQSILDAMPCFVIVADATGRIVTANPCALRAFGDESGLLANNLQHFNAGRQNPVARGLRGGESDERTTQGDMVRVQWQMAPMPGAGPGLRVHVGRDVTRLRVAQDFIANEAAEFRLSLLNILNDFEKDRAHMVDTQRATTNILADVALAESLRQDYQSATLNVLADLNEEKERLDLAEAALKAQARELDRSNTELQQFAYVSSHDLQEPLRTVHGAITRVANKHAGEFDAETQEYFRFAIDATTRMHDLIQGLLAYSRLGGEATPPVATDLTAVLQAVLGNLGASIEASKGVVTSEPLPTVMGNPVHLEQLLQNLVGNALKFRGGTVAPKIHIGARRQDKDWRITVTDNGIGIAPEFQARIFTIFQRLHDQKKYRGSGIGLAMVRKIAEQHGGLVGVESEPDRGSTFWLTIPAMKEN